MTTPVILHVPHSSRVIPHDVRDEIVLDDALLSLELDRMTDSFTLELAQRATEIADGENQICAAEVSRLVVDVERFPDEREVMNSVGMGAIYTRMHDQKMLRESVDEGLLTRYFHPHAHKMESLTDSLLLSHGRVLIADIHSYSSKHLPYEIVEPSARRPEVCIGVDALHDSSEVFHAASLAFDGMDVAINTPFAGAYVPLKHYGKDPRVSAIMFEIRRDTYMNEDDVKCHDGFYEIAQRLSTFLTMLN